MGESLYSPAFLAYRAARDAIKARMIAASARIDAIPGVGSGAYGLTPDHVKASPEWRSAHADYWQAHKALAELNRLNVRRFKREIARERDERRQAMLAMHTGE